MNGRDSWNVPRPDCASDAENAEDPQEERHHQADAKKLPLTLESFVDHIESIDDYKEELERFLPGNNEHEEMLLNAVKDVYDKNCSEFPKDIVSGCKLSLDNEEISCDLYWKDSKIALFISSDREGDYNIARKSDTKCFWTGDSTLEPADILSELMKGK